MMQKSKKRIQQIPALIGAARKPSTGATIKIVLPAILIVALLVRVIALIGFSRSIYADFLIWDERTYHDWAIHILQGKAYFALDFAPLPAYVMALVYKQFTADPVYVRALNILFGVLTCLFIYLIGRDIANRTVGLIACLVAALYKPFIFSSILILKESLGLFLFSVVIWCFVSLLQRAPLPMEEGQERKLPDTPWFSGKALVFGAAMGLLINVRQNAVVLIPVFLLLLMWRQYKRTSSLQSVLRPIAASVLGLVLSMAPLIAHNYRTSGEFKLSPPGGFNLYIGNNLDNPYPYYRPVQFATSVPQDQGVQFVIEASRRAGKRLSPDEASSFWNHEVMRIAVEHPGQLAWKLWQKTLLVVNQFEAEDNYDLGFVSRFVPFFQLPFFAFWFIAPLGIAALVLSVRRDDSSFALAAIVIVYALTMVLFFTNMRIRIPLLVILIPYAAMGLQMLLTARKSALPRPELRAFIVLAAIAAAVEFLPVEGTEDLSGHYNTHAINLASKGMQEEAVRYWEESSAMERPYSAYANLALADAHYSRGDIEKGDAYLNKVPDASFAAAGKYELQGNAYAKQGRIDAAIAAYERSLLVNSGQIRPRSKLIRLYGTKDPERANKAQEEMEYIKSFYPAGR